MKFQDTVTGLQKDLKELKIISKKLKEEIGNLKVLIQELNTETLKKQMIPYMREFYANNVKVLMKEEDNEVFKMKKEAANLEREKARLIREIDWAEKQIKKNEKFVGVYIYRHLQKKQPKRLHKIAKKLIYFKNNH